MREHLFRAKRIDNGEWVEGSLLYQGHGKAYIIKHDCDFGIVAFCEECCVPYDSSYGDGGSQFEVFPETVGQFTGLLDKNGKKIFESDIVRDIDGRIYQIKFFEYKWVADIKVYPFSVEICDLKPCEVIGNIHDNPEFIGEG